MLLMSLLMPLLLSELVLTVIALLLPQPLALLRRLAVTPLFMPGWIAVLTVLMLVAVLVLLV